MLPHLLHHFDSTDVMKPVDSSITQQSFLLADDFLKDFKNLPKPPDAIIKATVKAVEKEAGFVGDDDIKEIRVSIDQLKFLVAACFIATGASWFDLKQGVIGLLNEQQERALSAESTKLTLDVTSNIAVMELTVPKRLRGHEKSFTLESKDEGKVLELVYSHEGIVQTWRKHLPPTKIVEREEQKNGLSYTLHKEQTAITSRRAKFRIELSQPLVPRPWRLQLA